MLSFIKSTTDEELESIYDHNMSAFFDADEFDWTLPWLQSQKKDGWDVYGVQFEQEIIAAFFVKHEEKILFTKQTPLKLKYQGHGFSHAIKEEMERIANESKVEEIYNICAIDNFRMVALNESHGYRKTGKNYRDIKTLVEWKKTL